MTSHVLCSRFSCLELVLAVFMLSGCGDKSSGTSLQDGWIGPDPDAQAVDGEARHDGGMEALPFEPAGPNASPDPSLPGPFPVGVMTVDLFDESRTSEATGGPRFIRTEIWYPAVQSARNGEGWAYDIKQEGVDPNIDLGDKEEDLLNSDIGLFESGAVRDAGIDRDNGPYPVILFSHGAYSARFQYNFYTVHLASHGYIVLAPDHEGNTIWTMIRDGFDFISMAASAGDRIEDMSFLAQQVAVLNNDSESRLHGLIDPSRKGLTGHSLGGFTAVVSAHRDTGFHPTVALAPTLNSYFLQMYSCDLASFFGTIMIMGGTEDNTIEWKEQYCGYLDVGSSEKYLLQVDNGGHFTFSDMCTINLDNMPSSGGPDIENDGCSEANVPYQVVQPVIDYYATALFNMHLRGSVGSSVFLVNRTDAPFDTTIFYVGSDLPDWPGGCGLLP